MGIFDTFLSNLSDPTPAGLFAAADYYGTPSATRPTIGGGVGVMTDTAQKLRKAKAEEQLSQLQLKHLTQQMQQAELMNPLQIQQLKASIAEAEAVAKLKGELAGKFAQPKTTLPGASTSSLEALGPQPVVPGISPTYSPESRQGYASTGTNFPLTLDDVVRFKAGLKTDLLPEYKAATEGFERKPNTFYDNPYTGKREYVGDPTKGTTYNNGVVGVMPGYEEAQRRIAAANITGPQALESFFKYGQYPPGYSIPGVSKPIVPQQPTQGATHQVRQQQPTTVQQIGAGLTPEAAVDVEKERRKGQNKYFVDTYDRLQTGGIDAQKRIEKVDRLEYLLNDVYTGKLTPLGTELAAWAAASGFNIDKNLGNKQAAISLANEMALQLRNPSGGAGMPGSLSDSDREYLRSMTPNLATTPEGRKLMLDTQRKIEERSIKVAQLAREYKNGNLDNGFYKKLQEYSDANPLFPKGSAPTANKADLIPGQSKPPINVSETIKTLTQQHPPGKNRGKIATDDATGKKFVSNGMNWVEMP